MGRSLEWVSFCTCGDVGFCFSRIFRTRRSLGFRRLQCEANIRGTVTCRTSYADQKVLQQKISAKDTVHDYVRIPGKNMDSVIEDRLAYEK